MEIKIVIPSAGRAKKIITTAYVNGCILCVPESEKEEYEKENSEEVVCHPDTVVGLGAKRNWIYKTFGNVFMIDDDIYGLNRLYRRRDIKVGPADAYHIIQNIGNVARLAGCYLFGFNKSYRPMMYSGLKPFQLTGFIPGAGIGLLEGSMLKFNSELKCNNDSYVCLLNAFFHRKCMIDMRYCCIANSICTNISGLSNVRTREQEAKDIQTLNSIFGSVVKLNDKKSATKKMNISLRIPF